MKILLTPMAFLLSQNVCQHCPRFYPSMLAASNRRKSKKGSKYRE
jgi:hypothetical protein